MARPGASAPARRSPPSTPSAAQQPTAAARVPEAASGLGCVPTAAPSAVGVVRPLRVAATADELQRFASRDAARRVGTPAQSTPRFGQRLQGLGGRVLREGRRFGRRLFGGCARCFAPHDPLAAFNVPALDLSKAVVLCGEDGIGKVRFAMAHGRRPYLIDSLEALVHIPGRCDLLVFDGLCLDGLSPEEVLALVNVHEQACMAAGLQLSSARRARARRS